MSVPRLQKSRFNLDSFIHVFAFISVLLIGADIWGVRIRVNFRLDQLFLVILSFLLYVKGETKLSGNRFLLSFVIFSFFATLNAFNLLRGAAFFCLILYNVIFVYLCFYNYILKYGIMRFVNILRKTCYVQFFIMVFQLLLKTLFRYELPFLPGYGEYMGILRFSIWFYEPSYLATYLIFWFTLSLTMLFIGNDKSYIKDIALCLYMFLLATSTSGFVGIAFSFVLVYILWLTKGITLKKISVFAVAILLIVGVRFFMPSLFHTFIRRLFEGNLNGASGGRIEKWKETYKVFKENLWFGVGPGCYGLYLGQDAGYVPTNVTLDLMATVGIFATVAFYVFSAWLAIKNIIIYLKRKDEIGIISLALALGFIAFTVILQVNQGYLRLYYWLFFGVLAGAIRKAEFPKNTRALY